MQTECPGPKPLTAQAQSGESLRIKKWLVAVFSVAVLAPCWWHPHIEAGDLASHVYNAWLAQLIEKGQAPGLYVVRQWNNVLVDWLLLHAANLVGFTLGEQIVVSLCVLLFFWGVFAFVRAASVRTPWFLVPCIAMLAYGYVFNMGFMNFYLSVGLASLSLALLWKGRGIARLGGFLLVPFVLLAHPLGILWLVGTAVYILFWTHLPAWWKLTAPAGAAAVLFAVHWYLAHKPAFEPDWERPAFFALNGADQLVLYTPSYALLAVVAVVLGVACLGWEAFSRRADKAFWESLALPCGLYVIAVLTTSLLPQNLRPSPTEGFIGLLVSRLTVITAIFGLCVLGQIRLHKVALAGFAVCAAAFFGLLYRDTGVINRMETQVEGMVRDLPPGTRVLSTIWSPPGSHISFIEHFVDRACIEHCFSFGNYEPSTGQFRVRAREGNGIVTASYDDSSDMQAGEYEVQDEDLPMKEIYQCDPQDLTKLCIRDLAAGELNGRLGYKPPPGVSR